MSCLCPNCQVNVPKYECQVCNCCYCLRCDSYIHSFPSKRTHLRKYIQYKSKDVDNNKTYTYQENNISNYNQFKNEEINCDEEPKNIFIYDRNKCDSNSPRGIDEENELNNSMKREEYSKKISSIGDEIIYARENFDNKLEALHEHFHIINENKKIKMNELNKKNLEEINILSSEKGVQIKRLKEIIDEQLDIINQLQEDNNNLKNIYNGNKRDIEKLNLEKQEIIEENNKAEEMNNQKMKELLKVNEEEKSKLIEEYNEELSKLKDRYFQNEELFKTAFNEKQKSLNDYIEEANNEKKELSVMIDRLITDNNNKLKETESLKERNENLEKMQNEREEQYNAMKSVLSKEDL